MSDPKIMTVTEDQDIETLVRRLYVITGRGAPRLVEEAVRAIQDANPHLDIEKSLPAGMTILLPDVTRLRPELAGAQTAFSLLNGFPDLVSSALNEAREALAESRDRAVKEANETLEIANNRAFIAAASEAELGPRVETIISASKAVLESADAEARDQEEDMQELAEALAEFVRAAGLPDGRG